jgi:decaprenylphospho-beta-D-ribofuranose 2-oxidase
MNMLPNERLEWVEGWGMAVAAAGYVFRPTTVEGVREAFATAHASGVPVVLRGSGRSYGDAALRAESAVVDLSRMNRILSWDPTTGVIDVEPGVTIRRLWRYVLGDGWWPPVVTGTMAPTVGGCLAMNVHGKNNWRRGTFGEHCLELDLLLPSGEQHTLKAANNSELFHAVIGSFGQLGVVVRARLQMKRVHSGLLHVRAVAARDLETMLRLADEAKDDWEYVVGWIDAFARGRSLGRGLLHFARHLDPGEDPAPAQSLRAEHQDLPDMIFGVLPKAMMWRLIKPWTNRTGMRWINRAKFLAGSTLGDDAEYHQSLAEFSFLLDYVPHWKQIYRPGGLIQHQSFVPKAEAEEVMRGQLEACQNQRMPSYLAVLKRHRPDSFLLTHAVDGFSLALDLPVVEKRREELWKLVRMMAEPVVAAGGRFYPAKDAALPADLYRASLSGGQLDRFDEVKARVDPEGILRSALADRLVYGAGAAG